MMNTIWALCLDTHIVKLALNEYAIVVVVKIIVIIIDDNNKKN